MVYIFFLLLPLLLYALFAMAVLFHLERYALNRDALVLKFKSIFIIASVVVASFAIITFFSIPWDNVNLDDILQNMLNR